MAGPDNHASGSCLCGAITFTTHQPFHDTSTCHCRQCQKSSGYYWAAGTIFAKDMQIRDPKKYLKWFQSSHFAKRGFCGHCGSFLFWADLVGEIIDISLGALDSYPPDMKIQYHIWLESKPNYYEINDDLPKYPQNEPNHKG